MNTAVSIPQCCQVLSNRFFQVWITLHIWFPRSNRLASTDQIFGTPSYSGLLTELSFMLNRRSDSGRLKFRYDSALGAIHK